ncbi:MAG: alkaline phosphatase [Bacteroidaceae bacterium]
MKRSFSVFLMLFVAVVFASAQRPKYVFFFIGDGMGVNQVNGTRVFISSSKEEMTDSVSIKQLLMTTFPVASVATTHSATNRVTDSAASGTALATGHKTYNHAIGVDVNKQPLTSIAYKAKRSGYAVGIASTVGIDHATPASFYAHQTSRNLYYEIASELPATNFDFFAGSGFFASQDKDHTDILTKIEEGGYTIVRGYDEFETLPSKTEKVILIQKEGKSPTDVPYAINRDKDDLTLTQITKAAIKQLSKNKKGFFVMLEGGKIDWACHGNDAATTFREVVDLDQAVKVAYDFYLKHPKETLIVITADHETGGLAMGTGAYHLNFGALHYQACSIDKLTLAFNQLRKEKKNKVTWEEAKNLLSEKMGFWKHIALTWPQERKLHDTFEESFVNKDATLDENMYAQNEPLATAAKEVMNSIALISWASNGHSDGLVPVYAIGAGADEFKSTQENSDIPVTIERVARYK